MSEQRTRTEIYEEAQDVADEVFGDDPDFTHDEAMAMVWEEAPDLYAEYSAAPAGPVRQPIAKSAPEYTLGDHIHQVIQKRAAQQAWTAWPHKSIEQLEADIWDTPEGRDLYDLYRTEGNKPMSEVSTYIAESDRHRDARTVLYKWAG